MADLKTQQTDESVQKYLNAIEDPQRNEDCKRIHHMMKQITGKEGSMWGDSMVGYGSYHYKYESGREGDWFLTGFSNRKQAITLYIMAGFSGYEDFLSDLGKHKTGKSCLYIKQLDDINVEVLKDMIQSSVQLIKEKYKDVN